MFDFLKSAIKRSPGYHGAIEKAGVEGAIIPAKGNAYRQARSLGPGDAAAIDRRNGDERDFSGQREDLPLRAPEKRVLNRPSALTVSVLKTPPKLFPAMQGEPARQIPAGLAAEDDEESEGRRLAARFVRPPAETAQVEPGHSMRGLKPFLAVGVFFVAAVRASLLYLSNW